MIPCVIGRNITQYFDYGASIYRDDREFGILHGCTYIVLSGSVNILSELFTFCLQNYFYCCCSIFGFNSLTDIWVHFFSNWRT